VQLITLISTAERAVDEAEEEERKKRRKKEEANALLLIIILYYSSSRGGAEEEGAPLNPTPPPQPPPLLALYCTSPPLNHSPPIDHHHHLLPPPPSFPASAQPSSARSWCPSGSPVLMDRGGRHTHGVGFNCLVAREGRLDALNIPGAILELQLDRLEEPQGRPLAPHRLSRHAHGRQRRTCKSTSTAARFTSRETP
jgi:hypothetical protein